MAEHGIATFPVGQDKKPLIRNWPRVGLGGSAALAAKFAHEAAFAFTAGKHSGLTVIDIDSCDENKLAEALATYGPTPFIVRTPSGGFHLYYRNRGEPRRVKHGDCLDLLGGGLVIAPPSLTKGVYRVWRGELADLGRLPVARIDKIERPEAAGRIPKGKRDDTLFHLALEQALYVDDLDSLVDVVRTHNLDCEVPLSETELIKIAASAWGYEQRGENLKGKGGAMVTANATFDALIAESADAWLLYSHLQRHHWGRDFVLAKAMADAMGWRLRKWKAARDALIRLGLIGCIHPGGRGPHDPPIYSWGS